MRDPAEIFAEALKTYQERSRAYGNTWEAVGAIMAVLYPDGAHLASPAEHARYHMVSWLVGKIVRASHSGFVATDSIHDAGVYCFLIEAMGSDE